jgi:hypothetical protein
MITLRRRTITERLLYVLVPAYRRKHDAALRKAIREAVMNPNEPVQIDGTIIYPFTDQRSGLTLSLLETRSSPAGVVTRIDTRTARGSAAQEKEEEEEVYDYNRNWVAE